MFLSGNEHELKLTNIIHIWKGNYFNLLEGNFTNKPGTHTLTGRNIIQLKSLLGINFDGIALVKMNKSQRRELLRSLVNYYEIHLQGFRKPRSLDVLDEVFS